METSHEWFPKQTWQTFETTKLLAKIEGCCRVKRSPTSSQLHDTCGVSLRGTQSLPDCGVANHFLTSNYILSACYDTSAATTAVLDIALGNKH
jgi:hypothetical protein